MVNRSIDQALTIERKDNMTTQIELTKDERPRILRELQTVKCFCGRKKGSGKTFCQKHYYALPKPMQSALYQRFGEGYEEAYTAARKWLKEQAAPTRVE